MAEKWTTVLSMLTVVNDDTVVVAAALLQSLRSVIAESHHPERAQEHGSALLHDACELQTIILLVVHDMLQQMERHMRDERRVEMPNDGPRTAEDRPLAASNLDTLLFSSSLGDGSQPDEGPNSAREVRRSSLDIPPSSLSQHFHHPGHQLNMSTYPLLPAPLVDELLAWKDDNRLAAAIYHPALLDMVDQGLSSLLQHAG